MISTQKNRKLQVVLAAAGIAALGLGQAQAIPTLQLSDNNGHSVSISNASGLMVYNSAIDGPIGSWTVDVSTGIASPPSGILAGTLTQPILDLNSINIFNGNPNAVGNILTITLTGDNLGPLVGEAIDVVGGT